MDVLKASLFKVLFAEIKVFKGMWRSRDMNVVCGIKHTEPKSRVLCRREIAALPLTRLFLFAFHVMDWSAIKREKSLQKHSTDVLNRQLIFSMPQARVK
jgi:hypothetical protein